MISLACSSFGLLLALSATSLAASIKLRTPRSLQTYSSYDGYYQQMLDAVNAERAKASLSALCPNQKLANAATRHSEDMAKNNFMDHGGSDGSTLSKRITDAEYQWHKVAENVAAGQEDVASVMESWMSSAGHRANILGADYTMLGTSYVYNAGSTYGHYWTQDFAAGETEACDSDSPTSSQPTEQVQQEIPGNNDANEATSQTYISPTTGLPATFSFPSFKTFVTGNRNTEPPVPQTPTKVPTTVSPSSAMPLETPAPVTPATETPAPVTLATETPVPVTLALKTSAPVTPISETPVPTLDCKRKK